MNLLYFVSFVFIIFNTFHSSFCVADFKECKEEGVTVSMHVGDINLPSESGKNCTWIIEIDLPGANRTESLLFLETIRLGQNDSLTISSVDEKNITVLLTSITASLSNNLFFTGTKKNLSINLVTSADDKSPRSFHLQLRTQDNKAPIPILDDTVLKFLPLSAKPDNPVAAWTLELSLSSNLKKKIAVSVDEISSGISLKFDNKEYTNTMSDQLGASGKMSFVVNIKDISVNDNALVVSIYSVAEACSSYNQLKENEKITVTANSDYLQNLINVKCLWIVESDKPNNWLNINFDSKDDIGIPAGNSFVVRKGNRKSSPVLFVISSSNYNDIKSNIYNSIFDSSSLYITYEAFETHGEHPHFDIIRPSVNNFITDNFKLDFSKGNMPSKFLFKAKANSKAVLSAAGQIFQGTTYIYDQPVLSPNNLLAVFSNGDTCPDSLWSDSDLLILDFSTPPGKLVIEFQSQTSSLGSTARQSSGSLVLFSNQLKCADSYSWVIPPKHSGSTQDYQIVKSLVISNLALEKGSSMSLTSLPSGKPHVLDITGENAMSLPTFYLDANISHSIKYQRASTCDNSSKTLIQVSIDTISYDACTNIEVAEKQDFVSYNYPNSYPLSEWTMSTNCRHMNSTSAYIYISFNDVDLADGHNLELLDASRTISINQSIIPGDTVVSNKVAVNFNRVFNNDEKTSRTLKDKLSGRGFFITLEPIECGGVSTNTTGSLQLKKVDKPQKCIFIIQTPIADPKTINVLNFTLGEGLKQAIVYDSNKRKDNLTVNTTGSEYFNSTTETIILEFTLSDKDVQMSWSTIVCSDRCLSVRKCINPSQRCNKINDCGDWSDELNCNGTVPVPVEPKIVKSGVPGLVVTFVIIPLAIIFGVIATIMAPKVMARIRGGHYQEFREYSDVS